MRRDIATSLISSRISSGSRALLLSCFSSGWPSTETPNFYNSPRHTGGSFSDMNGSLLSSQSKAAHLGRSILVVLAVAGLTFSAVSLRSQTNMNSAKPSNASVKQTTTMKTFVLIFRQPNHQPLTDAEKQSLAKEMGPWARH